MDTITFTVREQEALRRLGVTGIILFGSQARGLAGAASDYDVGVLRVQSTADVHQEKALYEELYDMLATKIGKLVNIDIVFLEQAPMELAHHVAKFGLAIYEEHPQTFARFKELVMERYADFAQYRQMFQKHILGRIPS